MQQHNNAYITSCTHITNAYALPSWRHPPSWAACHGPAWIWCQLLLGWSNKSNVNTHVVYITNTYIQSTLNIQGHILFGSTTSSNSRTSCVYIHAHTNTHTYTIKLLLYNKHIIITSPSLKPTHQKLPCGCHHPSYPEQACIKWRQLLWWWLWQWLYLSCEL